MQLTIVRNEPETILEDKLCDAHKIFATKNGVLQGMIVKICGYYVLMIACDHEAYHLRHETIVECIQHGRTVGYSFYVEDGE